MSNSTTPILQVRDIRKTYRLGRVDVPVLKGASLEIQEGEWVAILGASGSGKSTLLHVIGNLDQPDSDSGEIRFNGVSLQSLSPTQKNQYRNLQIGFVFQFYHLMPELSVVDNTLLPMLVSVSHRPPWLRKMILAASITGAVGAAAWLGWFMRRLGLEWNLHPEDGWIRWCLLAVLILNGGIIGAIVGGFGVGATLFACWTEFQTIVTRLGSRYAQARQRARDILKAFGLSHRLHHRPRELSGGERQRVAIARALINSPRVLLADEPTGNLDEKTGAEILDLIAQQHQRGLTIVMVTHDPGIANRADRVVRLHDGRVDT